MENQGVAEVCQLNVPFGQGTLFLIEGIIQATHTVIVQELPYIPVHRVAIFPLTQQVVCLGYGELATLIITHPLDLAQVDVLEHALLQQVVHVFDRYLFFHLIPYYIYVLQR